MAEEINLALKKQFVSQQACFSKLNPDETEKLASLWTVKHFKAGDTIVTEGEPVDSVFLIVHGKTDVRHVTIENGHEKIQSLATLGPGDAIGLNETGFYSLSGVRTATVVALTDLVTLCLSTAEFHGFALAHSHVNEVMRKNAQVFLDQNEQP